MRRIFSELSDNFREAVTNCDHLRILKFPKHLPYALNEQSMVRFKVVFRELMELLESAPEKEKRKKIE